MGNVPQELSLVNELLGNVRRDLSQWSDENNPNRRVAGDAAVKGYNAVIRILSTQRHQLLLEMNGGPDVPDEKLLPNWAAGNSGPGAKG